MSKQGVVPSQEIRDWVDGKKLIEADTPIDVESQIQPASLDVRLSNVVYPLHAVFRPVEGLSVRELIKRNRMTRDPIIIPEGGYELNHGVSYLCRLQERLNMDCEVRVASNPKSSTGRADLSTKVIGDGSPMFDELPEGFQGELYVLITPLGPTVKVRHGDSLSQLRFKVGDARLDGVQLRSLHREIPILYGPDGNPIPVEKLHIVDSNVYVGADLEARVKAYRAIPDSGEVLDFQSLEQNPRAFFDTVEYCPNGNQDLILTKNIFYLLGSLECVAVPVIEPGSLKSKEGMAFCATMVPIDERYGDLRTHYAGFFDPGWGSGRNEQKRGKSVTMEVRGMDTPVLCVHGQALAGFNFERMRAVPDKVYGDKGSHYADELRGPQLSKHFSKYQPPVPSGV